MLSVYRSADAVLVMRGQLLYRLPRIDWDTLFREEEPEEFLLATVEGLSPVPRARIEDYYLGAPVVSQEVWAAGVTYYRSRDARMEESKDAGGASFYDRVYEAERPELFFKATPHRVVGHSGTVRIRADSNWNVPEPELTLAINRRGQIFGYTIGNDVSSRDIEGENPLYLPQAKVYDGCCALGPGVLVSREPLPPECRIALEVRRGGGTVFDGSTTLAELKRKPTELVEFLFRDNSFPAGCFLMTGTGIIPSSSFSLAAGDEIRISIDRIGTLVNTVACGG